MRYFSAITNSNYILPKTLLKNSDLYERFGEKKVESISKLSGIYERRVADEGVTAVDLGAECAQRMIEGAKIDKNSFDMLIFVSQTGDFILPASAFIIHDRLGLSENCGAFDISMGCSAFPYSLSVAKGLVESGQCKKVLLILAETITKLIHPQDRSLVPLHGDGAACFVVDQSSDFNGIEFIDFGVESSSWKELIVPAGAMRKRSDSQTSIQKTQDTGIVTSDDCMQMNGAAIFHFSISKIPEAIRKSMQKHSSSLAEYDLLLLHQANKMMLEQIYSNLAIEEQRRFFFMEKIGNLSAASTPVLLAEAIRQGKVCAGVRVLLASFGVGLAWAVASVKFDSNLTFFNGSTDF